MTIFPIGEPIERLHVAAATGTWRDHLRHRRARVHAVSAYTRVERRQVRAPRTVQ
jgi:hypothetical protein